MTHLVPQLVVLITLRRSQASCCQVSFICNALIVANCRLIYAMQAAQSLYWLSVLTCAGARTSALSTGPQPIGNFPYLVGIMSSFSSHCVPLRYGARKLT